MIAHARLPSELISPTTPAIAADALTRIPTLYFRDIDWARDSIRNCTAMVADAAQGDRTRIGQWIDAASTTPDVRPLLGVLNAVCDAIVADAFLTRGDFGAVSSFIATLQRDVLGGLSRERNRAATSVDGSTRHVIDGFVGLVALHHPQTALGLEATGTVGEHIASTMQLTPVQIATVGLAGRLHDIGNVSVPRALLEKPSALGAHERTCIERHCEAGAAVLEETPTLAHLAPIVRAHHERIDGCGYPDRLRADEIPLAARVIAVADAFVALTSVRPYRAALSPGDALDVLATDAGAQFDGDVVTALFDLCRYAQRSQRESA